MSNQPFYLEHNGVEYKRLNWRVWFLGTQRVMDMALVTQLEKRHSDVQRLSAHSPRKPVGIPLPGDEPPVRKAHHRTPRESRGKGRVE